MRRVYEVVGLSDYNVREIQDLNNTKQELLIAAEGYIDAVEALDKAHSIDLHSTREDVLRNRRHAAKSQLRAAIKSAS